MFWEISRDFANFGGKNGYTKLKIDPYCQRRNSSPLNV